MTEIEFPVIEGKNMNFNSVRMSFVAFAFVMAANEMIATSAYAAEFSFTAKNTTQTAITEVLVSEKKRIGDILTLEKASSRVRL